jgi:hypothetical protein
MDAKDGLPKSERSSNRPVVAGVVAVDLRHVSKQGVRMISRPAKRLKPATNHHLLEPRNETSPEDLRKTLRMSSSRLPQPAILGEHA